MQQIEQVYELSHLPPLPKPKRPSLPSCSAADPKGYASTLAMPPGAELHAWTPVPEKIELPETPELDVFPEIYIMEQQR
jgi:hypothetical protein